MAHLLKVWCISHDDAKQTLEATSLYSVWTQELTLLQNYRTNDCMLHYKRIKDYFFMDTFFTTSKGGKSSHGNTCCQLFVTEKGFIYIVPLKQKSEVLQEVKQFAKESGAPDAILCDMAGEQLTSEVKHSCNTIVTTLRALEVGMPWSNKAELYIKLMKESVRKDMKSTNSQLSFWDYCLKRRVCIYNLMAHDHIKVCGSNPHTITAGEEGNISNLCCYGRYEWCYFHEHTTHFPYNQGVLGRVLGFARGEGQEMSQWALKSNG